MRIPTGYTAFLLAFFCSILAPNTAAENTNNHHTGHGLTLYGKLKYDPDFRHFEYVNPDAPKGGTYTFGFSNSFDSLNPYIILGNPPQNIGNLIYDTLMTPAGDEPASVYGLIAESIAIPDDFSWVEFRLREEARWHDGSPITVEDVIFTFNTLKEKGSPVFRSDYADVMEAVKTGDNSVRFNFREKHNRGLAYTMAQMPVLPKQYWEEREFDKPTLEPPLSGGPYRIARVDPGRSLTYERVENYWARDLPVNRGRHNFDRIVHDFYRDISVLYEAVIAGNIDLRWETLPNQWVKGYDIPAVKDGYLIKEMLEFSGSTFYSGLYFNLRKEKFQDRRVREAISHAFDFEWINKTIFSGQYKRVQSHFENTELAARGKPSEAELELLKPFRDQLDPRIFNQPWQLPKTDATQAGARKNLREAVTLLREAGYSMKDGRMISQQGKPLEVEILLWDPFLERAAAPFIDNLKRIGIRAKIRQIDTSEWARRMRTFEFDMTQGFIQPMPLSPGTEQREIFGSASADQQGSRNQMGIRNPVVDALIEKIVYAEDRKSKIAATRAMDRVLLWNFYSIPTWYAPGIPVAYWNRFGYMDVKPTWGRFIWIMSHWWVDPEKDAALKKYLNETR
ncbi:MAG: extracellular solute-binding protein [Gammaproteobacteria bacterium]